MGCFRKRIPQIGSCRVRILMRSDVLLDSVAEGVLTQKTLQHSQERLAFFVGEIVKRTIGFGFRCDTLLNRMRGGARVPFHRGFLGDSSPPRRISRYFAREPDFPLRIEMLSAFAAHPRREPFIEP